MIVTSCNIPYQTWVTCVCVCVCTQELPLSKVTSCPHLKLYLSAWLGTLWMAWASQVWKVYFAGKLSDFFSIGWLLLLCAVVSPSWTFRGWPGICSCTQTNAFQRFQDCTHDNFSILITPCYEVATSHLWRRHLCFWMRDIKPVLNCANVCSPERTSDTSTNYDSFLNWTFSSPNMVRTVQTLLHS